MCIAKVLSYPKQCQAVSVSCPLVEVQLVIHITIRALTATCAHAVYSVAQQRV